MYTLAENMAARLGDHSLSGYLALLNKPHLCIIALSFVFALGVGWGEEWWSSSSEGGGRFKQETLGSPLHFVFSVYNNMSAFCMCLK